MAPSDLILRRILGMLVMRSLISISGVEFWRWGMWVFGAIVARAELDQKINTEVTEERRRTQRKIGLPQRRRGRRERRERSFAALRMTMLVALSETRRAGRKATAGV